MYKPPRTDRNEDGSWEDLIQCKECNVWIPKEGINEDGICYFCERVKSEA